MSRIFDVDKQQVANISSAGIPNRVPSGYAPLHSE
jgi:hypothetical protein